MADKKLQEDLNDLAKAFEKLGLEFLKEWKSLWFVFVGICSFLLGMIVEHYFAESTLLSILWK